MDLSGRVAVVTGAGSGLGAVVSARLADRGAVVVVVDVDPDAAGRTSASLPGSVPVVTDLSRPVAVDTVAAAVAGLAPPALLVNNAGGWGTAGRQFPDAAPDEWRSVLALNLVVPMALTQRLLGPMADAGCVSPKRARQEPSACFETPGSRRMVRSSRSPRPFFRMVGADSTGPGARWAALSPDARAELPAGAARLGPEGRDALGDGGGDPVLVLAAPQPLRLGRMRDEPHLDSTAGMRAPAST